MTGECDAVITPRFKGDISFYTPFILTYCFSKSVYDVECLGNKLVPVITYSITTINSFFPHQPLFFPRQK